MPNSEWPCRNHHLHIPHFQPTQMDIGWIEREMFHQIFDLFIIFFWLNIDMKTGGYLDWNNSCYSARSRPKIFSFLDFIKPVLWHQQNITISNAKNLTISRIKRLSSVPYNLTERSLTVSRCLRVSSSVAAFRMPRNFPLRLSQKSKKNYKMYFVYGKDTDGKKKGHRLPKLTQRPEIEMGRETNRNLTESNLKGSG